MATPDRRVVSRPPRPGQGAKESGACLGPVEVALQSKAWEFFQTCDTEGKGFIARRDMQVRGLPTWNAKWHGSWVKGQKKRLSTLPWKEVLDQTLLGARSPGFAPFLAFACHQTPRLFSLSVSVTPRTVGNGDSIIRDLSKTMEENLWRQSGKAPARGFTTEPRAMCAFGADPVTGATAGEAGPSAAPLI